MGAVGIDVGDGADVVGYCLVATTGAVADGTVDSAGCYSVFGKLDGRKSNVDEMR